MRLGLLLALMGSLFGHPTAQRRTCHYRGRGYCRQANAGSVTRYLTPTGSTVSMSGVTFSRTGMGAACTDASGNVTFPADGVACVTSTGLHMRPSISNLAGANGSVFSSWTASNATVTSDSHAGPDGTTTADTVTSTASGGYVYEAFSSTGGAASISVYPEATSGTQGMAVEVYDATGAASLKLTTCTATTAWPTRSDLRCTASVSSTTSGHSIQFRIYPGGTAGTGTVYLWGGQPEWSAFPDDFCGSGTCNAETATTPTPQGMSATIGCMRACVTPDWTGNSPLSGNGWILSAGLDLYAPPSAPSTTATDGTHFIGVNATHGGSWVPSRTCFMVSWSASSFTLKNLTTGDSTSGAYSAVTLPSLVHIASDSGGTEQLSAAGIDTMVLGNGVNACN